MRAYITRVLIAVDQLFQSAFRYGRPGITISARAATARNHGHAWGCVLCRFLDWIEADHCTNSILGDIARARAVIYELKDEVQI